MSIANLLSIARGALWAQQRALDVTGNNIANAATPGYSRQRVRLMTETPLSRLPIEFVPRGVGIDGYERIRDQFLDARYRRESGTLAWYSNMRDGLAAVESVLGEPSDTGLASSLDAFWSGWADVANSPSDPASRIVLRQRGQFLAGTLNRFNEQLDQIRDQTAGRLGAVVSQVNAITGRLAELNSGIASAGGTGAASPESLDERDRLLDELAALVPVNTVLRSNGTVAVTSGEFLLVDGVQSTPLQLDRDAAGGYVVVAQGSTTALGATSGKLGALLAFLDQGVADARGRLDALAASLVEQVNALHEAGVTATGVTGQAFFEVGGVTAGTISVAAEIENSTDAIAAGASAAPGDGAIAQSLATLRDAVIPALGDGTFSDFYTALVTDVGAAVREAGDSVAAHDVLVAGIDGQRAEVSGVSIDEEMINLITFQQAYAAAARLVTVADELMQDLLRMV